MTDRRYVRKHGALIVLLTSLAAGPALALNWMPVLKNSPGERFDDEDLQLFITTARKTVNEAPDFQTVSWENPDTKHRGNFTILKTFKKEGRTCKQVRVHTEADGRQATSMVDACQIDGKWRLIGAPRKQ